MILTFMQNGFTRWLMDDLTGKQFNRWTVLYHVSGIWNKDQKWMMRCDCGTERLVNRNNVVFGGSKSCGCRNREKISERRRVHGMSGGAFIGKRMSEYSTWATMKDRCLNPKSRQYKDYGGRGIKVYERWMKFEHFIKDMGMKPSDSHTIERINNNGNYEPKNCRWATRKEQSRNTRKNRFLTMDGETKIITDWCSQLGMGNSGVHKRLKRGWTLTKSLTHPTPP